MPSPASAPLREEPAVIWEHYALWHRVREALFALPSYFRTETNIEGMLASDINSLNAALGATIEEQVVQTLNSMRAVWDPEDEYRTFAFVRQSQTFPDVLLRKRTNGQEVLMGIELKGWYLLAKEGMPNLRFTVTPSACAAPDLLVVFPWILANVLAGRPVVFAPFIELARYVAERRNYYWQHERGTTAESGIRLAEHISPYPVKSDLIADRAIADSGGNFGRLARYRIMDEYLDQMKQTRVRGIPVRDWVEFFRRHARDEGSD